MLHHERQQQLDIYHSVRGQPRAERRVDMMLFEVIMIRT